METRASGIALIMPTIFIIVFGGIGAVVTVLGLLLVVAQQRAYYDFRPTPAVVTFSAVKTSQDGNSYRPNVHYTYVIAGKRYHNAHDTLFEFSASGNWAKNMVSKYPVGAKCTAYVDPSDPKDSILINDLSFFPFGITFFGMVFLSVAVGILVSIYRARRAPAFDSDEAAPPESMGGQAPGRTGVPLAFVVIAVFAALLCMDYFFVATPPYGLAADIISPAVLLIAVILVWFYLRNVRRMVTRDVGYLRHHGRPPGGKATV